MEYGLALLGGFCGIPLGMEAFSEPFVGSMLGYTRSGVFTCFLGWGGAPPPQTLPTGKAKNESKMQSFGRTLHIGLLFWASCRHPMLTLGG